MSATDAHNDVDALQWLLSGMSAEARRAFLRRGFGPAITARLGIVEGLSPDELDTEGFERWLVSVLDHAGLDASMFELFHVVGGVPWGACRRAADAVGVPLTDAPPDLAGPAEQAREVVLLTVAGPPERERWSTRSMLAALQGLHRRLEASPALRTPAARPILAGVSEDERHLILRANPPTARALLGLQSEELGTVTGLPVTGLSGAPAHARAHRPMVVALTSCILLLLASLVGKQWQLSTMWTALEQSRAQWALVAEAPPSTDSSVPVTPSPPEPPVVELAAVDSPSTPAPEAATIEATNASPVPTAEGLRQGDAPPADWMKRLVTLMKDSGATVDVRPDTATVAFSDELLAFAPGEATLSDASARPIRTVARFVLEHPTLDVWVEGHTDTAAYSSGNWLLGAQRALALVEALTRAGVPARRVALTSHGEHRPVASNATADGRRRNRRVEIVLAARSQR